MTPRPTTNPFESSEYQAVLKWNPPTFFGRGATWSLVDIISVDADPEQAANELVMNPHRKEYLERTKRRIDVISAWTPWLSDARDCFELCTGYDFGSCEGLNFEEWQQTAMMNFVPYGSGRQLRGALKFSDEALEAFHQLDRGLAHSGRGHRVSDMIAPMRGSATFADAKERSIAEYLEGFGRKVDKNPLEGVHGAGRQGDAFVDGVKHEFKTLDPGAASNTIKNVVNNSIRTGGQARNIVIDARGSGFPEADAIRGMGRAAGISRGKVDNITVIGDGFFLNLAVGNR